MQEYSIFYKDGSYYVKNELFINLLDHFDKLGARRSFVVFEPDGLVKIDETEFKNYIGEMLSTLSIKAVSYKPNNNSILENEFVEKTNMFIQCIYNLSNDLHLKCLEFDSDSEELRESNFKFYNLLNWLRVNPKFGYKKNNDIRLAIKRNFLETIHELSIENLNKLLSSINDVYRLMRDMYKYLEFTDYREQMLENLKCFCTEEEINNFLNNYDKLLNNNPIDLEKIEDFCKQYNDVIKNEYRKCMTNLNDYVPGSSFNFICHSVNGSQFSGDFKTKYVSTSFIDENIHEVYKSMYGFIFSPDNIVWANYEDSYIVNNSNSNEDISRNTVLPILMHPKLVMKKCIEQKQKNQVDKISKPVYNEIVLDGFNPIGIFCLSNGSKTLCNSYGGALKLKKAFPNLPIIDIDLTLYNNNSYDMFLKQELIYRLNSMFDRDVMNCDFILKKYDLFYEQFIKLKKQKNLTEEDIKNLYDDYTNKFIFGNISQDEIFSDKYTEREMYLYLDVKYHFSHMFKGERLDMFEDIASDFRNYDLNKIKNENIKNILFILMSVHQNIDINFFSQYFQNKNANNINEFINEIIAVLKNNKSNYEKESNDLLSDKLRIEKELKHCLENNELYQQYTNILNMKYLFKLTEKEIESNSLKKQKKQQIINEKNFILVELERLENEKKFEEKNNLTLNNNCDSLMIYISKLKNDLKELEKQISIFNKKNKLYKIVNKKQILLLENKKSLIEKELENIDKNYSDDILKKNNSDNLILELLNEMNLLKERLDFIEDDLSKVNIVENDIILSEFFNKTGMNFTDYYAKSSEAEYFLNRFDYTDNLLLIKELKEKLKQINEKISYHERFNNVIDENINRKL